MDRAARNCEALSKLSIDSPVACKASLRRLSSPSACGALRLSVDKLLEHTKLRDGQVFSQLQLVVSSPRLGAFSLTLQLQSDPDSNASKLPTALVINSEWKKRPGDYPFPDLVKVDEDEDTSKPPPGRTRPPFSRF